MRFVLGLIAGVVTVLVVAAMLPPAVDEVSPVAAKSTPAVPATVAAPPAVAAVVPAEVPLQDAMRAGADDEPEPVAAPAAQAPAPGEKAFEAAPETDDLGLAAASGQLQAAPASADSDLVIAVSAPDASTPPEPEPAGGQLSVWRPFHSEASAEGFARRLSTQLGHPFTVLRVAAAEYHVVFDYTNSSERELLQRQIATVTGRQP